MTYYGETPVTDGDYTVVRFLESGDFVTPDGVTEASKVLIVGGGAAGGTWCGGGGGAGQDMGQFGKLGQHLAHGEQPGQDAPR